MFERALKLIFELPERQAAAIMPAALHDLFDRLATRPTPANAFEIEDRIWELWTSHPDGEASALMKQAIAAIAGRRYEQALPLLDDLIARETEWAEAWNKRATLYFLIERDAESVADIERTLELEPRHFGALSGFAQICLRNGDATAAVVALEAALEINPALPVARVAIDEIRRLRGPSLH